ncbi:MAG TPA: proton-conducting transporter membrane subunit [Phycisphaerae bacterium]|nr:proton-conducting transporter membrane subunit [Phycisphaerae bacterium]
MNFFAEIIWDDFSPVYPILGILGAVFLLLFLPVILGRRGSPHYVLIAFAGLSISLVLILMEANTGPSESPLKPGGSGTLGSGLILDPMGWLLGLFIVGSALFGVLIASITASKESSTDLPEHFLFILVSTLGWCLVTISNNFLMLFVGLNMGALPLFLFLAQQRSPQGAEATVKICLPGLLCLGAIFYGMSLCYIGLHTTSLNPQTDIPAAGRLQILITLGLVLIVSGCLFFSGCLPGNSWFADIQEACSPHIACFVVTVPVLGGFAAILRLFPLMQQFGFASAYGLNIFSVFFIACGIITCVWNSLAALAQRNMLRTLGYLINSLAGGILLSLGAALLFSEMFSRAGLTAVTGDLVFYILTVVLAIPGILALLQDGKTVDFSNLPIAASRHPLAAFCAVISVGSLAGFPLTCGFIFKLRLLALLTDHMNWIILLALMGLSISTLLNVLVWLRLSTCIYSRSTAGERIKTVSALVAVAAVLILPNAVLALAYGPLSQIAGAFPPAPMPPHAIVFSASAVGQN